MGIELLSFISIPYNMAFGVGALSLRSYEGATHIVMCKSGKITMLKEMNKQCC